MAKATSTSTKKPSAKKSATSIKKPKAGESNTIKAAKIVAREMAGAKKKRVKKADISSTIRGTVTAELVKKGICKNSNHASTYFHNLMHIVDTNGYSRTEMKKPEGERNKAPVSVRQALGMKVPAKELKAAK